MNPSVSILYVFQGPLYEFINTKDKLDPTDAAYIDVLHTDIGMFGSSEILGTADFYANGGKGYAQAVCLNFTNSNPGTFISGNISLLKLNLKVLYLIKLSLCFDM